MEAESWVTGVYKEYWNLADELARKEGSDRIERRDKHLDAMVAMFIATMEAPVNHNEDEEDCEECDNLNNCKTQWQAKQN